MLANLTAGGKILTAFVSFSVVTLLGSAVILWSTLHVANQGITVGERLAPLVDAAMEIKLSATNAHLRMEEIMAGDPAESIDDVYGMIDEAEFYAKSILNGGTNAEGQVYPTESPKVRETINRILSDISSFREAVSDRYKLLEGRQGAGSAADIEFDGLYDKIKSETDALASRFPSDLIVQRSVGEIKYQLAHGHLLVEEALGGDAGEDFSEAIEAFKNAVVSLEAIRQARPENAEQILALIKSAERFAELAQTRYDTSTTQAHLMENSDVTFDASFTQFVEAADSVEALVQSEMNNGIANVKSSRTLAIQASVATGAILLTTIVIAFFWLDRSIGKRLTQLSDVMRKLLAGKLDVEAPAWHSSDEVGILRDSVDQLREALLRRVEFERQAQQEKERAEQQRELAEDRQVRADLARASAESEREISRRRAAMVDRFATSFGHVVDRAVAGHFDGRINDQFDDPDLVALSSNTNRLMSEIEKGIQATVDVIASLAKGDLTKEMEGDFIGEFGRLQSNVSDMIKSLRSMVLEISNNGVTLSSSSEELRSTSTSLSRQAEQNAVSVTETFSALSTLTGSIEQVQSDVSTASRDANDARDTAQLSEKIASEAASSMDRIADASKEISRVLELIDEIAFQINLLALNAGVEAARAGDAGRGFSVVASEVRALAQRASDSSREISIVIAQSDAAVSEGVAKVSAARESLDQIAKKTFTISHRFANVLSAISEQAAGIKKIASAIGQIDQNTQRQAASFEEVTTSSGVLANEAVALRKSMMRFQTLPQQNVVSLGRRPNLGSSANLGQISG